MEPAVHWVGLDNQYVVVDGDDWAEVDGCCWVGLGKCCLAVVGRSGRRLPEVGLS